MIILNLTQHPATPEQIEAGVIEPRGKKIVQQLLTFDDLPTQDVIDARAIQLADYAASHGVTHAMIGGAPWLMHTLADRLFRAGITPLYAFSTRESVEEAKNGDVVKRTVFRHVGFVEAS